MKAIIGLTAVAALVYRAWARKSLTPLGLVVAAISATAHALHPWSTPFLLLAVFYYGGTKATKVSSKPYFTFPSCIGQNETDTICGSR
jgi:uncharacterized membrane protein